MIKVTIKKDNIKTHEGIFDSHDLADAWINECSTNGYWPMGAEIYKEDITKEFELQQKVNGFLLKQNQGCKHIAVLYSILSDKNLSQDEYMKYLSDPIIVQIERLIWNGDHETAKIMIRSLGNEFLNQDEKAKLMGDM